MIELRYYKKQVGLFRDGMLDGTPAYAEKVLQYRVMENPEELGMHKPIWSEWKDVPSVWEK